MDSFLASREALIATDLGQDTGTGVVRKYGDLMDRFVRSLFVAAGFDRRAEEVRDGRIAVVALGSYGRRELCLQSDVDLLVVYEGKLTPTTAAMVPRALYPLWDAKLDVGHAVRTAAECESLAFKDFTVLTSLLDGRFLAGSRAFYQAFAQAFQDRLRREARALLEMFQANRHKREEQYSGRGYLVEPDIKEGLGGLRDLHLMGWTARAFFGVESLSQIKRLPAFSRFGLEKLGRSKGFLLKVRNHLHVLAGRREDKLVTLYQQQLPGRLGYRDTSSIRASEALLRDLYAHLNHIRYSYGEFQSKTLDLLTPHPAELRPERLGSDFLVREKRIVLRQGGLSARDPLLILQAFSLANERGLFLGSEFIWEAGRILARRGRRLAARPEARALFLDLVMQPHNPKILRLALQIGLIDLFVPEFKGIRNLAHFGRYHEETVDRHSLKTLEVINHLGEGRYDDRWPLFRRIFGSLRHPEWLRLAGLLHDIGKGLPGNHAESGAQLTAPILTRLGITGEALTAIPSLVRQHLLLINISQKRDLNDERTAVQAAQSVGSSENLKQLFLLTVADSLATGPLASGEWKMMLLIELFSKVRHILEGNVLASPDATRRLADSKAKLLQRLVPSHPEERVRELMEQVSARYFLNTPLEDMVGHFRLALSMGGERLCWRLQKLEGAPVTRVIQCTHDRPGLFSRMVGVFTLNNIQVLSANISVLKNGLAFDVYEVTNPLDRYRESEQWEKVRTEVLAAVEDGLTLDELVRRKSRKRLSAGAPRSFWPTEVRLDNEASDFFTVIEISAGARVGLLYQLAKALFFLDLDIRFARVDSDRERMRGVFYVLDAEGQKIRARERMEGIQTGIAAL